jgi:hypothetical protein
MKRLILSLFLLLPLLAGAQAQRDYEGLRDWNSHISANVEFDACRSAIPYVDCNLKFGDNEDVGTVEEVIWGSPIGTMNYWLPSAQQLNVTSTDVDDNSAGNGARTLHIFYLDANGDEGIETINLTGQTAVTTTASMWRVNRMMVGSAGTTGHNEGTIYIFAGASAAGVPSDVTKIVNVITIDHNQTTSAFYTVPANTRAMITMGYASAAGNKTASFLFRIKDNGVFRVVLDFDLFNEFVDVIFPGALQLKPLTDITVNAKVDTGAGRASAGYRMILLRDTEAGSPGEFN